MEVKNKKFIDLLDRSDYVKSCGRMSLNIDDGGNYLSILYDYTNNVFVEFDMDLGNKEINLLIYFEGNFIEKIYKPTIKKANEDKKLMKKNMSEQERQNTKFKIKKI